MLSRLTHLNLPGKEVGDFQRLLIHRRLYFFASLSISFENSFAFEDTVNDGRWLAAKHGSWRNRFEFRSPGRE